MGSVVSAINGVAAGGAPEQYVTILKDLVASGVASQTYTSTDTNKQRLATLEGDNAVMGITVASDVITVATAGTYLFEGEVAHYQANQNQAILYDSTGAAILAVGTNAHAYSTSSFETTLTSVKFIHTISASNDYEFRVFTEVGGTTAPVAARAGNDSAQELYAQLKITKLR